MDVVIVNPCVIIGAGDWQESSLTMFATVVKGLRFYTSGANAFVDARDVALIMLKLMNSDFKNERYLCIGENSTFKNLFDTIARNLNKKEATILVNSLLIGLTWRVMWVISKLTGKKSPITKETARSAFGTTVYDASKIKKALSFEFKTINEILESVYPGATEKGKEPYFKALVVTCLPGSSLERDIEKFDKLTRLEVHLTKKVKSRTFSQWTNNWQ